MNITKKNMNWKIILCIMGIYMCSVVIRSYYAIQTKVLIVEPDELIYFDVAKSILHLGRATVHHIPVANPQVIYGVLLAPFMWIRSATIRMSVISIFNVFLLNSSMFPLYLMFKKLLGDSKKALVGPLFFAILPETSMSMTFMAENLFYPLCFWVIYIIVLFFCEDREKLKNRYNFALAVIFALSYYVKEVALFFAAAFVATQIVSCIFMQRDILLTMIKRVIVFAITLFTVKKLFYYFFVISVLDANIPSTAIRPIEPENLVFACYCIAFTAVTTFIAYGMFPIITPLMCWKHLKKKEKELWLFSFLGVGIAIVGISVMISIHEDIGNVAIRQHLRYFAPFYMIFFLLFVDVLYNYKQEIQLCGWLKGILLIPSALILCIFRLTPNNYIDGVQTQFFTWLRLRAGAPSNDVTEYIPSEIILKLVLCVVLWGVLLIFANRRNWYFKVTLLYVGAFAVLSNVCATKKLTNTYAYYYSEEQMQGINHMMEFLAEREEDNVLVVTNGFNKMIETYFPETVYYTFATQLDAISNNSGVIDLNQSRLMASYPGAVYDDLYEVDYIITDGSLIIHNAEEVGEFSSQTYKVYKMTQNNTINYSNNVNAD